MTYSKLTSRRSPWAMMWTSARMSPKSTTESARPTDHARLTSGLILDSIVGDASHIDVPTARDRCGGSVGSQSVMMKLRSSVYHLLSTAAALFTNPPVFDGYKIGETCFYHYGNSPGTRQRSRKGEQ